MLPFTEVLRQMLQKLKALLFTNQTLRQTVAKNTFWLAVSNIGGRLLRAIIIIYAARVLGAAGWGAFSYAINFAGLLTLFTDLGIGPTLTREIAKISNAVERKQILSTAFFLRLTLAFLGVLVILFIAPRLTAIEESKILLPLIAAILVFDNLREFGFAVMRGFERMEFEAKFYILTNIVIVVLGFIFLGLSKTALAFTYAYALGTGVGMSATLFALRAHLRGLFTHFYLRRIKPLVTLAWPFAISSLLGSLMITTDIVILGFFRSAHEVGLYSAADRLIQVLYLIPVIIATSVFPAFARLARSDNEKFRMIMERVLAFSFLIALPLALGGITVAGNLIQLLFGQGYLAATIPLQILLITLLVRFPSALLGNAVFAFDRHIILAKLTLLGGTINIVLDLLLIPYFGMLGAAWTTLIAQVISNWYLWRKMNAINRFALLPHLTKIIPASLLMTVVTVLLAWTGMPLLFTIFLSAGAYMGMLYVLKEPLVKEAKLILQSGV